MTKPNALIVGAPKCGTTSLYRYLMGHPEVYFPGERKEINYFSGANDVIKDDRAYLDLYAGAGRFPLRMDVSTSYLYDAGTPAKIAALLGSDVKIVAVLRNPIDAAFSMWGQMRYFGHEPLSFEDALAAEKGRMLNENFEAEIGHWPENFYYTDRYKYVPQVRRYLDRFPRENVSILIFEEFFGNLEASWRALCRFLEIDPSYTPPGFGKKHNQFAGGVRSRFLHDALYKKLWWKRAFVWAIPAAWKPRVRITLGDLNKKSAPSQEDQILPATRRALGDVFDHDVRELEGLLGRSLKDVWF